MIGLPHRRDRLVDPPPRLGAALGPARQQVPDAAAEVRTGQAVDVLHDLLRRLAVWHLPSGRLHGADGSLLYRFKLLA
jgi:hypothetical protein